MDNQTINKLKTIDTLYFVLLTFFTLGGYFAYWLYLNIKEIKNSEADNILIFSSYVLIVLVTIKMVLALGLLIAPSQLPATRSYFWVSLDLVNTVVHLLFILKIRVYFNKLLNINKDSKYYFSLIWSLLLGPIYINININKIKGSET